MNAAIDFGGGHIQPFYLAFNAVPDGLERFLVVAAFQHNVLAAVSQNFPLTAFVPDTSHEPLAQALAVAS